MTTPARPNVWERDPELIRDVHSSWHELRSQIDRRLRVAVDEAAPSGARRRAAAWLAALSYAAETLEEASPR